MQAFDVRRIRSSVEETYAWVTLWFRGEGRNLQVLHVVCSNVAIGGSHAKIDHVYLERDDQAAACYDGAQLIKVDRTGIKVQLNKKGIKALELSPSFDLVVSQNQSGWQKAQRVFRHMSTCPTGHAIKVADSGSA